VRGAAGVRGGGGEWRGGAGFHGVGEGGAQRGEIAIALRRRWDQGLYRLRFAMICQSLVRPEEEHLVMNHRAACRSSVLVLVKRGDTWRKRIARIQVVVPEQLPSRSVNSVRARLGHHT